MYWIILQKIRTVRSPCGGRTNPPYWWGRWGSVEENNYEFWRGTNDAYDIQAEDDQKDRGRNESFACDVDACRRIRAGSLADRARTDRVHEPNGRGKRRDGTFRNRRHGAKARGEHAVDPGINRRVWRHGDQRRPYHENRRPRKPGVQSQHYHPRGQHSGRGAARHWVVRGGERGGVLCRRRAAIRRPERSNR